MGALAIADLPAVLATPLHPLYVIHGEEDLLRVEALDALRAAAKAQGYLNREVYSAEAGFDWNELLASAGSMGLFADLKLMEIHIPNGKPGKTGGEALQQLADDHFGNNPDAIHWGHVGDLGRVEAGLDDVLAIFNSGN